LHEDTKTLRARVAVHREINDMFLRMLGSVPDLWLWNFANIAVGTRIDQPGQPWRYSVELGATAIVAALRWNHRLSPQMRGVLFGGLRRKLWKWLVRRVDE